VELKAMRPALALELADAERLLDAALAEALRNGSQVAAAVVDGGGRLIAFRRLDGASAAAAEAAIAKARMAALSGNDTAGQEAAINGERPALLQLAPVLGQPAAAMGGGLALRWEGNLVGGLGVSGMTPQRDAEIAAAGAAALPPWPHLDAVSFSCADAEACAAFFCSQLGFRRLGAITPGPGYASLIGLPGARLKLVRLALGQERLELLEVQALGPGQRPGRPFPADSRSNDLWFQHICIVVRDLEQASAPVREAIGSGALQAISSAPQRLPEWNAGAAGIEAFKLHSPEGHCLELLAFPADKGDARWHGLDGEATPGPAGPGGAGVFLGIDHSAIGVADTERSCRFYNQLLGLRLGGDGINEGPEQDGLDGLAGTRVRITGHRCPSGAGIECLDYRTPAGGRPMPADLAPQDRAHGQLRLVVGREPAQLAAIAASVEQYGGRLLSPGVVTLAAAEVRELGFTAGLQLGDPDGHRLQLVVR
jgi:uncharacterized protein GlcG (DUF336 family)/catechol 2,3-dioxygenase-like lactoylglutathione lyase family enzyme